MKDVQPYWSLRDEVILKDGIATKSRRSIMPMSLEKGALDQLHVNHINIERIVLLTSYVNINADIEIVIKM